jgi:HSP20 family molecular chaperone IbpA
VWNLAGVAQAEIDLRMETLRIVLRGHGKPPGPEGLFGRSMRILALEIDHGPLEREIELPVEVNPEGVRAEHRRGVLWIHLPVRAQNEAVNLRLPP